MLRRWAPRGAGPTWLEGVGASLRLTHEAVQYERHSGGESPSFVGSGRSLLPSRGAVTRYD